MPLTEADPPIGESILIPNKMFLGTLYVCESCDSPDLISDDAITHWIDNDDTIQYLRPRKGDEVLPFGKNTRYTNLERFHGETSRGVWYIGKKTMVKVHSYTAREPEEYNVIDFISRNHPEIPITQVHYYWRDPSLERSYMIMRSAEGKRLDQVWDIMSDLDKKQLARDIAVHISTLSQHTSTKLETIDKVGVTEGNLVGRIPLTTFLSWPSWKPWQHPTFTVESFRAHIETQSKLPSNSLPNCDEFVLYNPDINPQNIFVVKGKLARIIDWEYTAFWPRYWIGTAPGHDHVWIIRGDQYENWGLILKDALKKLGFNSEDQWYRSFFVSQEELRNEKGGPEYESFVESLRKQIEEDLG